MQKAYNRINWENYPGMNTPLNEANLNRMDAAINEVDNRVISLDATKATKTEVSELFSEISFDESSGVLTFTRKNGGTVKVDTKLEKLAVNFSYDANNERLVITLDDGSVQYVDMKALITQYEFAESDTIVLSVDSAGKVKATIKNGSITGEMLEPNYLANVTVQAESARASASAAATSAANAAKSEENAQKSEANAEISADTAGRAASAANENAIAASGAASAAVHYANETQTNADEAAESAGLAKGSADTATNKATAAANSASAAATSAANAAKSEENAQKSEANAGTYASNAEDSAESSASSATNAASSASAASASATAAASSETNAKKSETNAASSASSASTAASTATSKATAAANSASAAASSASTASSKASAAATSATNAAASAETAAEEAERAETAADRAESVVAVSVATTSKAGIVKPDGSTIKVTNDGTITGFDGNYNSLSNKPSIPAAVAVKGNAESSYRTGNVNITPANIGAADVETGTFTLKNATNSEQILNGNYYKVGKIVYLHATGTAPSNLSSIPFTGFPFSVKDQAMVFKFGVMTGNYFKENASVVSNVSSTSFVMSSTTIGQGQSLLLEALYLTN